MARIECPSEAWDRYCDQEERANMVDPRAAIDDLDAYGHLTWTVGNEDWIACADFTVVTDDDGEVWVAYSVVVDCESGGFVDTLESGVVRAVELPVDWFPLWGYLDICAEHYAGETEPELQPDYDGAQRTFSSWTAEVTRQVEEAFQQAQHTAR